MSLKENVFLAQQLKLGDSKAYEFLMDSYYQNLCSYAFVLTKDKASAEDIVQNVFVKIWENRKNIKSDFSVRNYFYKAVYNEFIDQYRKNKPVIYLEKKHLEASDLAVESEKGNIEELILLLEKEISNLPPKCKRIFMLNKKEGLTHLEISKYLDVSTKTVEGHMTKAFKILGGKLGAI